MSTQNYNHVSIYVGNSFSDLDNLTWVRGRHTVKAGVEIPPHSNEPGENDHGKVKFTSVENLAADKIKNAALNSALPMNGLRKWWVLRLRRRTNSSGGPI